MPIAPEALEPVEAALVVVLGGTSLIERPLSEPATSRLVRMTMAIGLLAVAVLAVGGCGGNRARRKRLRSLRWESR